MHFLIDFGFTTLRDDAGWYEFTEPNLSLVRDKITAPIFNHN